MKKVTKIFMLVLLFITVAVPYHYVIGAENEEQINVIYEYNSTNNEVTAKIISNVPMKDTKPTWKLSQDKKTYTKLFLSNMNYSTPVQDEKGNIVNVKINITQIKPATIKMEYEYNEKTNKVTAKMISNTQLQDTKPTWKLSNDKKIYTKTFSENTNYKTPVVDINGNTIQANINITQIKIAQIKMEYEYNNKTNTVVAKMISDIELKDTKPSWKLSQDKKLYTKSFTANTNYSTPATDKFGNIINVNVKINQIDNKAPEIKFTYQYNDNNTVTIYMNSNEKMGATKPTWKLSEDCLKYEKTFSTDQDYKTDVQDIYGNSVTVQIKLKMKQQQFSWQNGSKISVRYMYTVYDNVIAQIVSSIKMKDTKPTWELSEDGFTYTKIFNKDEDYATTIQSINGEQKEIKIQIDYYYKITNQKGFYGKSGAKLRGVSGGSDLQYYRFGDGENVLFATFCVHGYEDAWDRDGTVLVDIANNFYNRLVSDQDKELAKKWTIYIFPEVNPDGRRLGTTNNGPGRTTLYSKASKGIDINRCWQTGSTYQRYTSTRNYNGTTGFQAYEAEYLRDFLLSHKSTNGKTVLVDLHGWLEQLIGDEEICKYYKQQYTTSKTTYGRYGTQYLIAWARQNLGAKVALVELPEVANYAQVNSMRLSDKYINATLNMLKGL